MRWRSSSKLSNDKTLEAQVKRMLADPRAEALSTRFAAQWLRLQDLDKVRPDAFWFPDYDQQLADAMGGRRELFFNDIVAEQSQRSRSVHGRLHVRERAPREALRHSERRRVRSSGG